MHITFTGHHVLVTPALKAYSEEKLRKLSCHFDAITSIHVVYFLEKLEHLVEATVSVSQAEIHARAKSTDMYAAVDALEEKLSRQLTKYKEKRSSHRADSAAVRQQKRDGDVQEEG